MKYYSEDELKTLKDIDGHTFGYDNEDNNKIEFEEHVFIKFCDLKKEVIKWLYSDKEIVNGISVSDASDFIHYFFNITDKDLKEVDE